MDTREGKEIHDLIDYVGLRTHAIAAGFVQLSAELVRLGVLGDDAIARIKNAIANDIALKCPPSLSKAEFERTTRVRLDRLFAAEGRAQAGSPASP